MDMVTVPLARRQQLDRGGRESARPTSPSGQRKTPRAEACGVWSLGAGV